jgi:hypothetical protein
MKTEVDYTAGGILPPDLISFIRFTSVVGFISALVLTTAVFYKSLGKKLGEEKVKKYRWVFVLVDVVILFAFIFIYVVVF